MPGLNGYQCGLTKSMRSPHAPSTSAFQLWKPFFPSWLFSLKGMVTTTPTLMVGSAAFIRVMKSRQRCP